MDITKERFAVATLVSEKNGRALWHSKSSTYDETFCILKENGFPEKEIEQTLRDMRESHSWIPVNDHCQIC